MKKEEFKSKAKNVLDQLVDRIGELEGKINYVAEDVKEEYFKQIENLRDIRDKLSSKLDDYDNIADSKWDVVKDSAANFFSSVSEAWKENYDKVADAFKKDAQKGKDHNDDSPFI